ncbi:MAG: hypothetical protein QGG40_16230, partial [Myxococcota bacterium]|nr:hypothetical protein [Myxococcota bacterium]
MTHTTKIVLVGSLLCASACKTISKKDMLVNSASLKAEPQEVWNRPTEVGFTMGKTIEGSSDTSKLLMIIHAGGDPIKSSISIPTFGASAPSLSSNARWAIARAVEEA